eukprot:scaffold223289_cov21-Tisochrysis_lutea.AAC.2
MVPGPVGLITIAMMIKFKAIHEHHAHLQMGTSACTQGTTKLLLPGSTRAREVDDSLTWDFVPWLKSITKLPVIIKVRAAAFACPVCIFALAVFLVAACACSACIMVAALAFCLVAACACPACITVAANAFA